jgi:hypothetical protein
VTQEYYFLIIKTGTPQPIITTANKRSDKRFQTELNKEATGEGEQNKIEQNENMLKKKSIKPIHLGPTSAKALSKSTKNTIH